MPQLVAHISEERQWDRLMQLASLGAIPGHGVNRQALTALDRAARRLMIGWAAEIGAAVSIDEANNLFLRLDGVDNSLTPVLTGSHLDSQPKGGRFDGAYGVVAGLEAITALAKTGLKPHRPIEVVAWTNEEGSRFAPGCTGSMSWAGTHPPDHWNATRDTDGVTYGEALAEQMAAESDLPRRALGLPIHAYVEAHIEQGPVLEAEGIDIGVVTGIQGSRWFTVVIEGESAHAGTAPLSLRRDAMIEAVRAIAALSDALHDPSDVLRFTVGRMAVSPNASNSVADRVEFSIDLRHPDAATLREKGDGIEAIVQDSLRHCSATLTERFNAAPLTFSPLVTEAVERAASEAGFSHRPIPSGAFHDAQFAARRAPAGMIFVPSHGGISHNPAEYTSPAQLAAGSETLLRTLWALASA
jgi:N-carbamoyl-L-amino-acid hydrolase